MSAANHCPPPEALAYSQARYEIRAALHEVWKYYDEAGESGENYVLAPDNLAKFAADLCKEYEG